MGISVTTTYRYIVREPGVCGGRPVIKGSRTPVQTIVGYYKLGLGVDEILDGLPQLTAAQVYEALSYYHDHVEEIESATEDDRVENVMDRYGLVSTPDGRIVPRGGLG